MNRLRNRRSATWLSRWAGLLLLAAGGLSTAAQETNAPTQPDYAAFRLINERNIFNSRRSAGSGGSRPASTRTARVDAFTLVGTLSYEKGPFAFFEGTSSEFRKVIQPEETIAGYKVTNISGHGAQLEAGTNRVELLVGMQMRREEEGEWELVARPDTLADTRRAPQSGASSTGASSGEASSGEASSGDDSDIVKKMMQKREQDLK
jgi:hypothetical protein